MSLSTVNRTLPIQLPPQEWVQRVISACLEVIHGHRNVIHLKHVVSRRVAASLTIRASMQPPRPAGSISVVRIHQTQPKAGVGEIAATFMCRDRAFPLAMRIEKTATGWMVTAIEIGPH
jgi:hypothetical protein